MTRTLKMMDICCLLLIGDSLKRIRFRPLRKSGFQAVQRLGKQLIDVNSATTSVVSISGTSMVAITLLSKRWLPRTTPWQ
jgi:hypothetical protein